MPKKFEVILKASNRRLAYFEKEQEVEWQGPFFFIQAADTQLGLIAHIRKEANTSWTDEVNLARKAIAAVNLMTPRPRFLIICGDMVNDKPGREFREDQIADFKAVMAELSKDIPLICVCGNHDIGNAPTKMDLKMFNQDFGDDYFVFWCGGLKCIVLNSQFYEDRSLVPDMAAAQDRWLDLQLSDVSNHKHTIIFQHIPWFVKSVEEDKTHFNIVPEIRMKMLKKFCEAGVRTIFCGHYHRNGGGFYEDLEIVVTSAIGAQFGNDLSGLRVVSVTEKEITHRYYSLNQVPQYINQ